MSFDRIRPSELPIFLIWINSPSAVFRSISFMPSLRYTHCITQSVAMFNKCFTPTPPRSAHPFQLVDHARNHRQPAVPEFRVLRIQPEWFEQFGIMLGAAGGQHRQIALGEAALRIFVDR